MPETPGLFDDVPEPAASAPANAPRASAIPEQRAESTFERLTRFARSRGAGTGPAHVSAGQPVPAPVTPAIPQRPAVAAPPAPAARAGGLSRSEAARPNQSAAGVPAAAPTAAAKKAPAKKKTPPKPMSTSEGLKRLGLDDPREALLCLPESFSDLRAAARRVPADDDEDPKLYLLRYSGQMRIFSRDNKFIKIEDKASWQYAWRIELDLYDEDGFDVTWHVFGRPWKFKDMVAGEPIPLVCRMVLRGERVFLKDFERPPAASVGKMWVRYLGMPGRVTGEMVESLVTRQLDNPDAFLHCSNKLVGALGLREAEALKSVGCDEADFTTFEQLLRGLHQPVSPDQGWRAKIIAQRLGAAAVQASALRHNLRSPHAKSPIAISRDDIAMLVRSVPYRLTGDQTKAIEGIVEGLTDPTPSNILLSGDVGTGKTLAYAIPAVAAHRAGAQVMVVAPTDILADQIAREIISRFGDHVRGVQRVQTGKKITDHAAILVGTTGIVSVATRSHYVPNVLISDEQHKMSAEVRERLIKAWTHTIDVSATPVPRSLASALFGGKKILHIRECASPKNIRSLVGDVADRKKFVSMLKWALDNGRRAAVIYPLVDSAETAKARAAKAKAARAAEDASDYAMGIQPGASREGAQRGGLTRAPAPSAPVVAAVAAPKAREVNGAQSVIDGAAALEAAFPGKVIAIHGQMTKDQVKEAIELVRSGERPLVVASTVIETGVDIAGITAMVVRNADRFGVSQLHQLRGRLARDGGEAWFGMLTESLDDLAEDTLERLNAVARIKDGYELAELDLLSRGFGDLEGESQSGTTDTVFRLMRLEPHDYLRKRLTHLDVKARALDAPEDDPERRREDQPRLFG